MSGAWVPLKKVVVQWMGQVEVDFSCSIVLRPFIGPSDYGLCPLKLPILTLLQRRCSKNHKNVRKHKKEGTKRLAVKLIGSSRP